MTVSDLYKELGLLTKDRKRWDENIPYVVSLLIHESVKIKAKEAPDIRKGSARKRARRLNHG